MKTKNNHIMVPGLPGDWVQVCCNQKEKERCSPVFLWTKTIGLYMENRTPKRSPIQNWKNKFIWISAQHQSCESFFDSKKRQLRVWIPQVQNKQIKRFTMQPASCEKETDGCCHPVIYRWQTVWWTDHFDAADGDSGHHVLIICPPKQRADVLRKN